MGVFFCEEKKPSGESDTVEGATVPEKNLRDIRDVGACVTSWKDAKIGRDFSPEN